MATDTQSGRHSGKLVKEKHFDRVFLIVFMVISSPKDNKGLFILAVGDSTVGRLGSGAPGVYALRA